MTLDKLPWFKFSPTDWIMGKIQRCPDDTQGRYMRLACLYWIKGCELTFEDAEIEIDKEHLDILISKKVVKRQYDFITISFLDEQMDEILETSRKNSENVKKRWDKHKKSDTTVLNNHTTVIPNHTTVLNNHTTVIPSYNLVIPNHTDKIREDKIILLETKHEKFINECLESYSWMESLSMREKIPFEKIEIALKDFNGHLFTTGQNHLTMKDYKYHFVMWVKKRKEAIK